MARAKTYATKALRERAFQYGKAAFERGAKAKLHWSEAVLLGWVDAARNADVRRRIAQGGR